MNLLFPECFVKTDIIENEVACTKSYFPFIVGSLGACILPVILISSISYLAIHNIVATAFGLAFSLTNTLRVLMFLILDPTLDAANVLDLNSYTLAEVEYHEFSKAQ